VDSSRASRPRPFQLVFAGPDSPRGDAALVSGKGARAAAWQRMGSLSRRLRGSICIPSLLHRQTSRSRNETNSEDTAPFGPSSTGTALVARGQAVALSVSRDGRRGHRPLGAGRSNTLSRSGQTRPASCGLAGTLDALILSSEVVVVIFAA
jgi:hypothetical protein